MEFYFVAAKDTCMVMGLSYLAVFPIVYIFGRFPIWKRSETECSDVLKGSFSVFWCTSFSELYMRVFCLWLCMVMITLLLPPPPLPGAVPSTSQSFSLCMYSNKQ